MLSVLVDPKTEKPEATVNSFLCQVFSLIFVAFLTVGCDNTQTTPSPDSDVGFDGYNDDGGDADVDGDADLDGGTHQDADTETDSDEASSWPPPGLLSEPAPSPECEDDGRTVNVSSVSELFDALTQAQHGDDILVAPGDYELSARIRTSVDGTEDRYICVRAADPADRPVFIRADGYLGELLMLRNPYYVFDGLVFDGGFADRSSASHDDGFPGRLLPHIVAIHTLDWYPYRDQGTDFNGNNTILRNCQLSRQRGDCLSIAADDVLVENTEIGYCLAGTFHDQEDAHAIQINHARNITFRHMDVHQASGDCLQIGSDICDRAEVDRQWDQLLIEHSRLWTGPLPDDMPGFYEGQIPGENALDFKTYQTALGEELSYCDELGVNPDDFFDVRSSATVRNTEVFGFVMRRDIHDLDRECDPEMDNTPSQYSPGSGALGARYRVDVVMDGLFVHDNAIAFRIAGAHQNTAQGGATLLLTNSVLYNIHDDLVLLPGDAPCDKECNGVCFVRRMSGRDTGAFRVEREIEDLRLFHNTFAEIDAFMAHPADGGRVGPYSFDEATYDARNNLVLDTEMPEELLLGEEGDNLATDSSAFEDASSGDLWLVAPLEAPRTVDEVDHDATGDERTPPVDYGAFEYE